MKLRKVVPSVRSSTEDVSNYGNYGGGVSESFADQPMTEDVDDGGNDRSTTISVAVRKRPKIKKEDRENDVVRSENDTAITVYAPKMRVDLTPVIEPNTFLFDNVFDERATNDDVYRATTKPLLETVRRGGSAVVFAFGQTGSGKTYTMLGHSELDPGIYSLAVADMLLLVEHEMSLTASFYEVYGSKLFDLLNDRGEVKVLQDEYKNIHIVGLRERPVDTAADLTELMRAGQSLRACGTTSANDRSSRSHAVLVLNLKQSSQDAAGLFGRMTFVDLAGSERASDTQNADKQTRREGAEINKSLLALKECIRAMGLKKRHIPFRGSKLTQILRESFIGNCQTCMIANVSPCQSHCEDTLNTLRYADRIKGLRGNGGGNEDADAPIPCANCGLPIFIGDRHVCRKVVAQCPHCRQEVSKDKMDSHLAECKELPLRCPHCNERVLQGELPRHNRKCSRFPTRCGPCGEIVARNMMEKHVQTECMQSKGACRYCRGQFLRMDLAGHEESCGHMQICCHYCLMVVKKAKMESHLAECSNNPQRIQRPRNEPAGAGNAVARKISMYRAANNNSPQPPSTTNAVPRRRPSARSRSPAQVSSGGQVTQFPQPPATPQAIGALKPRHAVLTSQGSCKYCARFVAPAVMANHVKNDCMYVPVHCPYEPYGCKWDNMRAKLPGHIIESTSEHLDMVQRYAEVMAKENHLLKEKIANLEDGAGGSLSPPPALLAPVHVGMSRDERPLSLDNLMDDDERSDVAGGSTTSSHIDAANILNARSPTITFVAAAASDGSA